VSGYADKFVQKFGLNLQSTIYIRWIALKYLGVLFSDILVYTDHKYRKRVTFNEDNL
ncbi:hypothetical protein C5L28_001178, partial [Lentilactobacillus parakefiri]